jgi:hypothetical protein
MSSVVVNKPALFFEVPSGDLEGADRSRRFLSRLWAGLPLTPVFDGLAIV